MNYDVKNVAKKVARYLVNLQMKNSQLAALKFAAFQFCCSSSFFMIGQLQNYIKVSDK